MIAAIRIITFAIVPNFASCQKKIIRTWEAINAINPNNHQELFLKTNIIAAITKNTKAKSQTIPIGFDMGSVNSFTSLKPNAFTNPSKWISSCSKTIIKNIILIVVVCHFMLATNGLLLPEGGGLKH